MASSYCCSCRLFSCLHYRQQAVIPVGVWIAAPTVDRGSSDVKHFASRNKMRRITAAFFALFDDLGEKPPCIFADRGRAVVIEKSVCVQFNKDPVRTAMDRDIRVSPMLQARNIAAKGRRQRSVLDMRPYRDAEAKT